LADGRQPGIRVGRKLDVVESDDRHVAGNRQAPITQGTHGSQRQFIRDGEERRAGDSAVQQGARGLCPTLHGIALCPHQALLIKGDAGPFERSLVPIQPGGGEAVLLATDEADVAVAESDEVVHRGLGGILLADGDRCGRPLLALECRQDRGDGVLLEVRLKFTEHDLVQEDDAVQSIPLQSVEARTLTLHVRGGEVEAGVVGELLQVVCDAGEELALEHVEGLGHHHPDGPGPLAHHIAGRPVGHIPGLLDRTQHPGTLLDADMLLVIQYPGDGRDRYICKLRYIFDTDHGTTLYASVAGLLEGCTPPSPIVSAASGGGNGVVIHMVYSENVTILPMVTPFF